jgi:dihydrofolate reductase
MSKLRVHCFGISLDGFGAGPNQNLDNPLGVGGVDLHQWFFPTRSFQKMHGNGDGTTGIDNDFAERGWDRVGAWILGRNMFAPSRGAWSDDQWKGWWGDNPPYHSQVFILTHHPRASIDQLHIAISPVVLGSGESLFAGIDLLKLGYKCTEHATSHAAMHVVLTNDSPLQ